MAPAAARMDKFGHSLRSDTAHRPDFSPWTRPLFGSKLLTEEVPVMTVIEIQKLDYVREGVRYTIHVEETNADSLTNSN
jgi:hypothetical protein